MHYLEEVKVGIKDIHISRIEFVTAKVAMFIVAVKKPQMKVS